MLVLLGLAARNLLRHKRRSILTGAMICVGTIAAILALSYGQSSAAALTNAVVRSVTGHLQIRAASSQKIDVLYVDLSDETPLLGQVSKVRARAAREKGVRAVTPRLAFQALLSTGEESASVEVAAVDPITDAMVFPRLKVVQGTWLTAPDGLLLSRTNARFLHVRLGQEFILMANGPAGYLNAVRLRVQGIIEAEGMETFLGRAVYMDITTARQLLYLPEDTASSLVVSLRDGVREATVLPGLRQDLESAGFKLRIDRWQDIGGIFSGIVSMGKVLPALALAVILLVVALGVINTVLMSVLERTREIGTLMALGTKHRQVLWLFLMEAGMLGLLAAGAGAVIAGGIVFWLGKAGIPAVAEAMEFSFGGKRLYLIFNWPGTLLACLSIVFMSILAAFFPARHTARLKPVEALRQN